MFLWMDVTKSGIDLPEVIAYIIQYSMDVVIRRWVWLVGGIYGYGYHV